MLVLSAQRPDASLAEFLVARARSASIMRLAIDAGLGATGCAAILWLKPTGWLVPVSVALCFSSYGFWGLLDRARSHRAIANSARLAGVIDAMCAISVALGGIAAAGVLFGVWAIALGTWIS
jgi:hypothetical protein